VPVLGSFTISVKPIACSMTVGVDQPENLQLCHLQQAMHEVGSDVVRHEQLNIATQRVRCVMWMQCIAMLLNQ